MRSITKSAILSFGLALCLTASASVAFASTDVSKIQPDPPKGGVVTVKPENFLTVNARSDEKCVEYFSKDNSCNCCCNCQCCQDRHKDKADAEKQKEDKAKEKDEKEEEIEWEDETCEPLISDEVRKNAVDSGSFKSKTNTGLNLRIDWCVVNNNNKSADVLTDIYLDSFSLYTHRSKDTLLLKFGDDEVSFNSPKISYGGKSQMSTFLASHQISIPMQPGDYVTVPIRATYQFNGTYSNIDIKDIIAVGVIDISASAK